MVPKAFGHRRRHTVHRAHSSNSTRSGEDAALRKERGQRGDQGKSVSLNSLPVGHIARVTELRGGRGLIGRLACLGFTPGARVHMLQNHGYGPLIVEVRDVRIALGRGEAAKIRVQPEGASK